MDISFRAMLWLASAPRHYDEIKRESEGGVFVLPLSSAIQRVVMHVVRLGLRVAGQDLHEQYRVQLLQTKKYPPNHCVF